MATYLYLAQCQLFRLQNGIWLYPQLEDKEYIEGEFFPCCLLVAGRKGLRNSLDMFTNYSPTTKKKLSFLFHFCIT